MAHEHRSGLPGAYNRFAQNPLWDSVVFRETHFAQAAEHNEQAEILSGKVRNIGDLIARDGDRTEGGDIVVDVAAGTVTVTAGKVYVQGRVLPVPAATLATVPMTGKVLIGVRLTESFISADTAPELRGLHPGTDAEGEDGASRGIVSIAWARDGDGGVGQFYSVYHLQDGVAVDQSPPPNLSGVNAQIAAYDFDANGNYIVEGCRVNALGKTGADQVFSIAAGVANVGGFKITRRAAIRYSEAEDPDLERIATEIHTFSGSTPNLITPHHLPIATINEVLVEKEITETVVRGPIVNGVDPLVNSAVTEIVSVVSGPTTYNENADWVRSGDAISWAPGGGEPTSGTSFDVTYRYLGITLPDSSTDTTVTVSGGVDGGQVQIDYEFKLPRLDILGLDDQGLPRYLKGLSARINAKVPNTPSNILPLALIENTWLGKPRLTNIGVHAYTMADVHRIYNRLIDTIDLVALERLRSDIDAREPVAKRGVYVDPFVNNHFRDAGEQQTAAVFGGMIRLPIEPTIHDLDQAGPQMLDFVEEVILGQPLSTSCMKINPYQNFEPIPAGMTIDPPVDFWVERQEEWADGTAALGAQLFATFGELNILTGDLVDTGQVEVVDTREELLEFLREITVQFTIEGFFPGENLINLTFDGLDVTPNPILVADGSGNISGSFDIPADVTAGSKAVEAEGQGGSNAAAIFVGQGRLETTVLRRIFTQTILQDVNRNMRNGNGRDPLAQTFTLTQGRFVTGVNVKICAVGDAGKPMLVELVEVENGIPTTNILAQAVYNMNNAIIGEWTEVRFGFPIWVPEGIEHAFVFKTNDADHSLHIARIGDFDTETQTPVAAQPYSIGVLLSSSNANTWTPHQAEDLTFQIVGARFGPDLTKVIALGSFTATQMSDLLVRAQADLPTADATFHLEVELTDGTIMALQPDQAWELQSYYDGNVDVRAVISGTATVSPILFPRILAVEGSLQPTGTYVSRAFEMGMASDIISYIKHRLPTGSSITFAVDAADDAFVDLTPGISTPLQDAGWFETKYDINGHNADPQGRLRITLAGTPAARPMAYDLRAYSKP